MLQRLQSQKVGGSGDSSIVTTKSQVSSAASEKVWKIETLTKGLEEVSLSAEGKPAIYKGESGKPLKISANYIRLDIQKGHGVFEYEVKFDPELDAKNQRIRMVNQMMRDMESVKVFDGGHCLYLPNKIPEDIKTYKSTLPGSDQEVAVTIIYKRQKYFGDKECLHLYNILFKRIMHILLYTQMGRNYFNPAHKHLIPQHKLEVYPGFAVTVDELEGGLLLCLDTQHKVLRNQNAYELLTEIRCASDPRMFKENAMKNIIGSCVFTRYNNKTYIIDDLLWDMTPNDTFPTRDGNTITFVDYYKQQYNITINDVNQPLLLHRRSVKVSGKAEKEDRMVCLVPELSFLTGLTDTMRNDFKVMKDIAQYTRVTPHQRMQALRIYLDNVKNSEKAQQVLAQWGLSIATSNVELPGRQLEPELIRFGNSNEIIVGPGADWNRDLTNNTVASPVDLHTWVVFYTQQDAKYANDFVQHMGRLARPLGCVISKPRMERLPNDQTQTYVTFVKDKIDKNVQVAVFICPSMRSDRYAVIKKLCCAQLPVASQVINSRTLSKPDKVRSIILKIALQINCKLGGSLWTARFPFSGWMICGIDVYHGSPPNSVCGFVTSMNDSISRWYSTALFQSKELGDFFKVAFTKSLEQYKDSTGNFPAKVIIIRDGVGDGQLDYCRRYEVEQFENVIKEFGLSTTICFVVVQKRINTRMFSFDRNGEPENPPPGTILDHTVTRKYLYDFFMVPQSVRQGTVNPTHYIVLHDTCKLKPDYVQRLCYKLCHLYYNWPGTIRVPAPCQYAHKLAAMVGQHVKTKPSAELADKLWFL
ncbi:piwi-like protein Ago3 isoform X2 [Cylas formicarius]|nr:piwi-like protein Ago3 isoform X2 [Cylas formicarius]XP_060528062.1 piwi-like protein Ago3 isoform X2 [Cylas formicarius]